METGQIDLAQLAPGDGFDEITLAVQDARLCHSRSDRFLRITLSNRTEAHTARRFGPSDAECQAALSASRLTVSGRVDTRGAFRGELVLMALSHSVDGDFSRLPSSVPFGKAEAGTVCPLPEQIYTEVMAQTELCGLMDRLLHWAWIAEREGRLTDSKVVEVVLWRALERAYCCGRGRVASRDLESAARRLLPGGPLDASDDSPALD